MAIVVEGIMEGRAMQVALISTYELGHQPFGLASPAAWLEAAGAEVRCLDLAVQDEGALPAVVERAQLIALYVPMHTATRLATAVIPKLRELNPQAHLCCFGLYAPLNEPYLRQLGVATILGGEFEQGLVDLYRRLERGVRADEFQPPPRVSLDRQSFLAPARAGLPPLQSYAFLQHGAERRTTGYTEASRGCKHLCRHCPIVPVYRGRFRIVGRDVVLADIRQQVARGARHITFGDPDFLNGPGHAIPLVQALHAEFPAVTYDATIKIEHLLRHADLLPILRDTGCVLITSAVESIDAGILERFDKRHSAADFERAVALLRELGIALNPTFVTWTPWTMHHGYVEFLDTIERLDLIDNVAPIQYAIRLLIPAGSKLLELPEVADLVGPFNEAALVYPWSHPDPAMDRLFDAVRRLVSGNAARRMERRALFDELRRLVTADRAAASERREWSAAYVEIVPRKPIPQLSEPWYC